MNKPIYKKWWFWVVLILVIGWIGSLGDNKKPADPALSAAIEPVKEVVAEATVEPTEAPSTAPIESPTPEPTTKPKNNPTSEPVAKSAKEEQSEGTTWAETIKQIAKSDSAPTEKADAAESLARKYKPDNEELLDYFIYISKEFADGTYLSQIDNDEYMLTNIFKSVLVEKHTQNKNLKDFAFDFYQNTKYTYRGVEAVDSDSVVSNEEQMTKSFLQIKLQ